MAGLDLSGVARFLDRDIVVDDVEILRGNGTADAVLDEVTGVLVDPAAPVAYTGLGAVLPIGPGGMTDPDVQRIVETTGATYRMLLPLTADYTAAPGDGVRVVATNSKTPDVQLTARRFKVVGPGSASSVAVTRFVYLKEVTASFPPEAT